MPPPDRVEILRQAKEAYREHGRGFVVVMQDDREEPHCGSPSELEESLGDDPDAKTLIDATAVAVDTYGPARQAVVINARPKGIDVMVIWSGGVSTVGEILWSAMEPVAARADASGRTLAAELADVIRRGLADR
jgi:hypothetical protein